MSLMQRGTENLLPASVSNSLMPHFVWLRAGLGKSSTKFPIVKAYSDSQAVLMNANFSLKLKKYGLLVLSQSPLFYPTMSQDLPLLKSECLTKIPI
ncbi:hypothetical protein KR94_03920 [Pantoea ananatis]|nr:hypothetical protein KR94_03920 [Pantoea ananatis]